MNEHEQILGIVSAKNRAPIALVPHRTALLVVDMQRNFTRPSCPFTDAFEKLSPGSTAGYLERVREIVIPAIKRLLQSSRAAGSPVVFTAVGTNAGDGSELPGWLRSLDELGRATLGKPIWPRVGERAWEIDEALEPRRGEVVLDKLSAGAFATTGLEQRLRHQQVESVVVTGLTSDVCVATTAREAADRGFRTILVSDGSTALSESMHQASLVTFNIAFGWVRSAGEVTALLDGSSSAV